MKCFNVLLSFRFRMFQERVWLCLDCLIDFQIFVQSFCLHLFLVPFGSLLVLFGCFWLCWLLGFFVMSLCCVKMLKVVLVCVSWCLFVSSCFSFFEVVQIAQSCLRFLEVLFGCVSCVGKFRFVIGKCGCFIMFLSCLSWLFWFQFVVG